MFAPQARAVRRIARVYPKTEVAPRLTEGQARDAFQDRGSQGERLAERCYQTCYHFLEKATRNRMNQGPSGWVIPLK